MFQLKQLSAEHREVARSSKKNWNIRHPSNSFSGSEEDKVRSYLALATEALPQVISQETLFCENLGLKYVVIPHEAFLQYESSDKSYGEWLDDYITKHNQLARKNAAFNGENPKLLDTNADVAICARVKSEESAIRKLGTGEKNADQIVDYVAIQYTLLKKSNNVKDLKSINTLKDLIANLYNRVEQDNNTMGYKDLFFEPLKDRSFRAFKTRRRIIIDDNQSPFCGQEIDRELKIEHESMMDINKLTRHLLAHCRDSKRAMLAFSSVSDKATLSPERAKLFSKQTVKAELRNNALVGFIRDIYNYSTDKIGLNDLISEEKRVSFPVPSQEEMKATISSITDSFFTKGNRAQIYNLATKMMDETKALPSNVVPISQTRSQFDLT